MLTLPFSDSLLSFVGRAKVHYASTQDFHSRFHHCEIPPRQQNPPLSSKRLTKWDRKKAIPEQIGAPLYIITIQFNSQLALPRLSYWLFFLGFRLFICFWIMSITRCRCSNTLTIDFLESPSCSTTSCDL